MVWTINLVKQNGCKGFLFKFVFLWFIKLSHGFNRFIFTSFLFSNKKYSCATDLVLIGDALWQQTVVCEEPGYMYRGVVVSVPSLHRVRRQQHRRLRRAIDLVREDGILHLWHRLFITLMYSFITSVRKNKSYSDVYCD